MSDDAEYDLTIFPDVVMSVLPLMPHGDAWWDTLRRSPGLDMCATAGEDGTAWLDVLSRGDLIMRIDRETFRVGATSGRARVMVDAQWRDVELVIP